MRQVVCGDVFLKTTILSSQIKEISVTENIIEPVAQRQEMVIGTLALL